MFALNTSELFDKSMIDFKKQSEEKYNELLQMPIKITVRGYPGELKKEGFP